MGQADRTLALLRRLTKSGGDPRGLEGLLAPGRVTVLLGNDVAAEPQAQLVFSLAVNLLGRLYPVVQYLEVIVPAGTAVTARLPRWNASTVDEHVRQLLANLNPPVLWRVLRRGKGHADCTLIVGEGPIPTTRTVFVGSDGWLATISPRSPLPIGRQVNPVGAYAAACLAVGEVCKHLLEPHRALFNGVPIVPLDAPLSFSTFAYRVGPGQPNPPLPQRIDLRRLTVVGLGAGGGALAFTLASIRDLRGVLHLVEPDEIIDPNLNRHVYADAEDVAAKRPKVEAAAALFRGFPDLAVLPRAASYSEMAPALRTDAYRYLVATVHSREARRELQFETPMVLWDAAATEQGEFFIWRMILGTTECMHCKHPTGQGDPEQEKAVQLTRLLGLDVATWLRKVRDNQPFTEEEIGTIRAHAASVGVSVDLPASGERYDDWERGQCGRLHLPEVDEEVPFPCAPVMAGVLLAGEIIKEHYFPEAVLDSYYWNTLFGRFMVHNQPHRRFPRTTCSFCHDEAFISQYRRRWGTRQHVPVSIAR